ncbi:hypothetical protein QFC21_001950 [Naganishia friedmannii]|uniref:Uncharacterized protein n=1 Tax=Naganishia friedmannii TaxID=89922 RepID=A0ACC2VY97_9TREE|nr:hypothetical protein QFC21_001950 [Naganishia friedmannii]
MQYRVLLQNDRRQRGALQLALPNVIGKFAARDEFIADSTVYSGSYSGAERATKRCLTSRPASCEDRKYRESEEALVGSPLRKANSPLEQPRPALDTGVSDTRDTVNEMTYGHLDMLVAYTRLLSVSSVIVAVSSAWTSSAATCHVPFTNIIQNHEDCGFYFDNEQPNDVHFGPKIWDTWNKQDQDELIRAVTTCWKSLSDMATEKSKQSTGITYAPSKPSTATETITVQATESHKAGTTISPEYALATVQGQRVLWRVSIMATTRESLLRLATRESSYQDWVLLLHKESLVRSSPIDSQTMSPGTHHHAIFGSDDGGRRPSLATNTSNSSTSSKLTHSSLKSSGSSSNRRIEMKRGVPLPIRAASEATNFLLPAESSVTSQTVITPSSMNSHVYPGAEENIQNQGHLQISDDAIAATLSLDDETSNESTVWDDASSAPVNSEDLVNLAINSPIGMVLATPELRLYWVNERWYEITRVEHGQDLNTWIEGVHPDSMPTLMEVLQGLMQDKVKRTGDIRWKHDTWSTFTAQVLLNAEGTVTAVAATIDDCTQRKTLELAQMEALKEKEATARRTAELASARAKELAEWQLQSRLLEQRTKEFAQMAEISSIALTCARPDGELVWANQAFPHEVNDWPSTVLPEDLATLNAKWNHLKNGRVLQAQTVPSVAGNNKDNLTFVSAIMDVTFEVRHHEAVERLNEERIREQTRLTAEAEERRKAAVFQKEQQALLIDVTSHELRNSINPILQSALLVKASLLEARGSVTADETRPAHGIDIQEDLEACDAIIDSANQMERVANDVLADPSRLSQTTVNLISNAMKFIVKSQVREVRIRIDISLEKPDDNGPIIPPSQISTKVLENSSPIYLYIAVHDTGPGMTKTELGKLFRRFSQANSDVHCQMGGSGLGLFIAKQLCELQGGRIEAISSPNEGATFRFFIKATAVKQIESSVLPSRPCSVPPKMPSMVVPVSVPPLHILVCDDNIVNRKTLARQLKQHKHKVVMAEDGQEALNVIFACEKAGTPFDCVCLDVNMPVLDGLAATRKLRVIEKDRGDVRGYWVVGCTGNARTEQINAVLESGMNAVITKPYNLQELLRVIQPPERVMDSGDGDTLSPAASVPAVKG